MNHRMFPTADDTVICFSHSAYMLAATFEVRNPTVRFFQTWTVEETLSRIESATVLTVSGFWRNEMLDAPRLRFVQSIGAGVDQFPVDEMRSRGIRLASAAGVNRNAVSEHVMAMMLAFTRQLHTGRDNQRKKLWRKMISNRMERESELGGKNLLIFGLGDIGSRVALLAKSFGMRVTGIRRRPELGGTADVVEPPELLPELLPEADFVVLTCPLNADTELVIDVKAFSTMKSTAILINAARGRVVNEEVLIEALSEGRIAGAGLDHFWEEPLSPNSPLWDMDNVIITPHTAGETEAYEERVIGVLLENLNRLWTGERLLWNEVV